MSRKLQSDSKTLLEAIREGKEQYKECPGAFSEEIHIKFAVCRFLWSEMQGHMDIEVLEVMQKITE